MPPTRRDEPLPWSKDAGESDYEESDYEVVPTDPEILEAERRRKSEEIAKWEAQARNEPEWVGIPRTVDFRFQFSVKDMLVMTTVVAVALAGGVTMGGPITFFLFLAMGSLAWVHLRLLVSEREESREKAVVRGETVAPPPTWREYGREVFRYSVADLLIATTVAAVVFALFRWVEDPAYVAGILGLWVFGWVVLFWMGARPSRRWWLIWALVCIAYVVFAAVAAIQR